MNRLVIIGAGGHGKVVADNALNNGYTDICFVDDNMTGKCMEFPILGTCADLERLCDGKTDFIIAIGDNTIRSAIAQNFSLKWTTLVHPTAHIARNVSLGSGTVVMAGAIVNTCAKVGIHCIVNTSAIIEHDNVIEDFVHISPGVRLGGAVHVGRQTHIGIGAVVANNVDICSHCMVGAGSVVVKTVSEDGTYVGVPARKILKEC